MSVRIFISYRKDDGEADAGRLRSSLRTAFGDDCVFMDSASIAPGARWPEKIESALTAATTIVVVIGPAWLHPGPERPGRRRIDDEDDWVRRELSRGFTDDKQVIPVLVRGAEMPSADALPPEISGLSHRQAIELRHDHHWDNDVKELIEAIRRPPTNSPADTALAELRRAMLAAPSPRELRNILYAVEKILARDPFSEEGRQLKDSLTVALAPVPRLGLRGRLRFIAMVATAVAGLGLAVVAVRRFDSGLLEWGFGGCRSAVVDIVEPRSGDHVSSTVVVNGTGTVRSNCRVVILTVRHRSSGVWTIADVSQVDDDGRWRAVAKLGESPDGSGEVEITARLIPAVADYRPGASLAEPPAGGVASNTVRVRRIE